MRPLDHLDHHPALTPQDMPRQPTLLVMALAAVLTPRPCRAFLLPTAPPSSRSSSSSSCSSPRPTLPSTATTTTTTITRHASDGGGDSKVQPLDWLEEVRRKNYEVRQLQETEEGARLRDRLSRMSLEGGYRVARALKRSAGEQVHLMSVVAEIKRRTPTGAETPTEVAVISDVGLVARQLADCGADVLLVTTDENCYGGSVEDLRAVRAAFANVPEDEQPPIVAKDVYIHPLQIAQAIEAGADGVLLMASLMGASLNELLDACTCLGTEALVEVHTVAELEKALELGATNIVATNWDRIENTLYPDQAKGLKGLIPDLIVAIGAGGVGTVRDAAELADMGYDAVVLGRGLAASADIERMISTIRSRESLPNLLTGAGMMAEELKRGGGE